MKDLLKGLLGGIVLFFGFLLFLLAGNWVIDNTSPYKNYSSAVELPDSPKAKRLVEKCLATQGYNDPKFKSSWRLNSIGDKAFFYCDIEEKIDYRERTRLDLCSTNPVRRYSWEEYYIL